MILRDLKSLYAATAKVTEVPIYKVEHIIKEGEFRYLRDWFLNPDKACLLLPDLGRFELHLAGITRGIKYIYLPRMREYYNEHNTENFRILWKMRKKALKYILSKRRKTRHDWREIERRTKAAKLEKSRRGNQKTDGLSDASL